MINGIKSFFKGRPAASGEEQTLSGEQQGSRSDWDEVEVDFQSDSSVDTSASEEEDQEASDSGSSGDEQEQAVSGEGAAVSGASSEEDQAAGSGGSGGSSGEGEESEGEESEEEAAPARARGSKASQPKQQPAARPRRAAVQQQQQLQQQQATDSAMQQQQQQKVTARSQRQARQASGSDEEAWPHPHIPPPARELRGAALKAYITKQESLLVAVGKEGGKAAAKQQQRGRHGGKAAQQQEASDADEEEEQEEEEQPLAAKQQQQRGGQGGGKLQRPKQQQYGGGRPAPTAAASKRQRKAVKQAAPAQEEEEEESADEAPAPKRLHGAKSGAAAAAARLQQQQLEQEQQQQQQKAGGSKQPAERQGRGGEQVAAAQSEQPSPVVTTYTRRRSQQAAEPQQPEAQPEQQQPEQQQPEQQQQPGWRQRSATPTPAGMVAGLELSAPPSATRAPAAQQVQQAQQQPGAGKDPEPAAEAAFLCLRSQLLDPRSEEAAAMRLRPRLQEAYDTLFDSLMNTVELGHNNSLMVMGDRGSGKTLAVERALAEVQRRFNTNADDPIVGVVRLSGFFHAEERAAFREAARQLCEVFKYSFSKTASVEENIVFLRNMLAALANCDKAVIFVLDEFDQFAKRKQTLLYNLLDALQTSGMQAAVVAMTVRHDVVEMLEKRVKSRFSHRKVDLTLPASALPVLPRAADDADAPRAAALQEMGQDGALDVLQAMLTLPPQFPHAAYAAAWNASVATAAGAPAVRSTLQRCINVYPSLCQLASIACTAAGHLDNFSKVPRTSGVTVGRVTEAGLLAAINRQLSQAKAMVRVISGLSVLDLIMLVAVHRLFTKGHEDINFEMAWHEFQVYSLCGGHVDAYARPAAVKAYDHLLSNGLLAFVDPRSEYSRSRQYAAAYLLVTREEIKEGMDTHWNCPQALSEWFRREGGMGTTAGQFL